jgi:hypothetical protein
MFAIASITLPSPVNVTLAARRGGSAKRTFHRLDLCFQFLPAFRSIYAQIAGIPARLPIYGPADWPHVLADSPENHAARVAEILGTDPAPVLQALIEGRALPAPPPRVPRELPNWRIKAALSARGLLAAVNAAFGTLPEAQRDLALIAWNGDAKCVRSSQSVIFIAIALGMDSAALDQLFRDAERLEI